MAIQIYDGKIIGYVLPHLKPGFPQLITFTGKRGMGKTTSIQSYVEVREPRALILDHYNDFPNVQEASVEQSIYEMMVHPNAPCRRRVVPANCGVGHSDMYAFADYMIGLMYDHLRNALFVGNEISLISKPQASKTFTDWITQSRRLGMRMACDAQRLSLVPYIIQSESTHLVSFKLTRPRDVRALAEWCDDETAQMCRTLDVGECVVVDL